MPLSIRGRSPPRSFETLKEDHKRFLDAGGDIKKAKEYNNIIGTALFPIPLDRYVQLVTTTYKTLHITIILYIYM